MIPFVFDLIVIKSLIFVLVSINFNHLGENNHWKTSPSAHSFKRFKQIVVDNTMDLKASWKKDKTANVCMNGVTNPNDYKIWETQS